MSEIPAIQEKLDYTQMVLRQINRCQEALMIRYNVFFDAVLGLYHMIPQSEREKDKEFMEQVKKAKNIKWVHHTGKYRTMSGGYFPRSEITHTILSYNAFELFSACLNFFHRRKMLWTELEKEFWEQ